MTLKSILNKSLEQVSTILSIFLFVVILIPNLQSKLGTAMNEKSKYIGINVDFVIKEPRIDQLNILALDNNVNQVTPFLTLSTTFNNNRMLSNSQLFSIPSFSDNSLMFFSREKLIQTINEPISSRSVLIDNTLSNRYNLTLNSELSLSFDGFEFTFVVHSIYSSIPGYSDGIAMVSLEGQYKDAIESIYSDIGVKFYYTGAFVDVKNTTTFIDYLKNDYIPLGGVGFIEDYVDRSLYELFYDFAVSNYRFDRDNIYFFKLIDDSNTIFLSLNRDFINSLVISLVVFSIAFLLNFLYTLAFTKRLKSEYIKNKKIIFKHLFISVSIYIIFTLLWSVFILKPINRFDLYYVAFPLVALISSLVLIFMNFVYLKQFTKMKVNGR